MINSFESDVALDVGINAAIIYRNIQYWCEKNETNDQNYHDGYFWTYNSISAFCKQFPYLSKRQIEKALNDLEEKKYIISGNYNKVAYDRTKWYADVRCKNVKCISPAGEMDLTSGGNGFIPEVKPIPNNNTINNTNNKHINKEESQFDEVLESVEVIRNNQCLKKAFIDFIEMRKKIKAPITTVRALKLNINKAYELANGEPDVMLLIVEQSIQNSYRGIFPLKRVYDNSIKHNQGGNEFDDLLKKEGYS